MPVGKPTVVPNTTTPAELDAVTRVQLVDAAGTGVLEPDGALSDAVVQFSVEDPVDSAGVTVPIKFAKIDATSDGDNSVVAAVALKKIRVLGYAFSVTAAGTVDFESDEGSDVVLARFSLAANGGASYAGGIDCPAFETAAGSALFCTVGAGVDAKGHLTYIEIDA
jgi:hypothetical protein